MARRLRLAPLILLLPTLAAALPVKDLCADRVVDRSRSQRQRLFLFDLSGLARIEQGERVLNKKGKKTGTRRVLKAIGGAEAFRGVWLKTFPMLRFDHLMAPLPAPEKLRKRVRISLSDLGAALGGSEHADFMLYSAACADYLAIPHVKRFEADWRQQQRKIKVREGKQAPTKQARTLIGAKKKKKKKKKRRSRRGKAKTRTITVTTHQLHARPTIELSIYRRRGQRFELVDRVEETGGGLFDFATDLGSATMKIAEPGNEVAGKFAREKVDGYRKKVQAIAKRTQEINDSIRLARAMLASDIAPEEAEAAQKEIDDAVALLKDLDAQAETLTQILEDPRGTANRLAREAAPTWENLATGFPQDKGCFGKGKPFTCGAGSFHLPTREKGLDGLSERSGAACKQVDARKMRAVAACEIRVRAENIALLTRKASSEVSGWRLFAPLSHTVDEDGDDEDASISLGEAEGVKAGAVFEAVRYEGGERVVLGYARVVEPGVGGAAGKADPSVLVWRAGDAERGARMEERAFIGIALAAHAHLIAPLDKSDEAMVEGLDYLGGFSLDVGYDLTPLMSWRWGQAWLRTHLDVVGRPGVAVEGYGDVETMNWGLLNFQAGPELKVYLVRYLDLFASAGGGMSFLIASTPDNQVKRESKDEAGDDQTSASTASLRVDAGFDVLLSPAWQLRLSGGYQKNFKALVLEAPDDIEEGESVFSGQDLGTLSGWGAKMGLNYIF